MFRKIFMPVCLLGPLVLGWSAVSAQTPAPQSHLAPATPATKPVQLDLNTASEDQLKALKGVGDKRAEAIIKGRPYKSKDELVRRKIISQGLYNSIKDKIVARQG